MIKAVILDFDGVLADSLPIMIECANELADEFGFTKIKDASSIRDKSLRKAVKEDLGIPIRKFAAYVRKVNPLIKENFMRAKMFKGVSKMLEKLSKKYQLGILTSNYEDCVRKVLGEENMKHIDFVYSNSSLFGKHVVIRKMLRKHKLNKKEIIYVGDQVRDIDACKKTGVKIIAVTYGYNSRKALEPENPDYIVDKPEEIIGIVEGIS